MKERRTLAANPLVEMVDITKRFGGVQALKGVDLSVYPGEVVALVGHNGAGKSVLAQILSGVYPPTSGEIKVDGKPVAFHSPNDARRHGIETIYQTLALADNLDAPSNFFLGREPLRGVFPFRRFDKDEANTIALKAMADIGIDVRDPTQAVGTLSGGERQSVAIARAIHFGAKVLILDEPTSALGVHQAAMVLKFIIEARLRGLAVIFISHNIHHAYPVGDVFTLLNRGQNQGTYRKSEISREEVMQIMSGGEDLRSLEAEIEGLLSAIAEGEGAQASATA